MAPDPAGIAAAVAALADGHLILHPTETVVSLSGDAHSAEAVERARRLKGYTASRPFLCLVADPDAARALAASWPADAERLAAAFWPGPLTLVLAAAGAAPAAVVADGRIALRPASEAVSAALVAAWGRPLFSTSANPRGAPPERRVADAARAFGAGDEPAVGVLEPSAGDEPAVGVLESRGGAEPAGEVLEPGEPAAGAGTPSSVIDVTGARPRLVREGAIAREALARVCPELE